MRNKKILDIINLSKEKHNNKNSLFLEKYLKYYYMKVIDNYILYESFNGKGIIDNPYGLFKEFINRDDFKKYVHIWVLKDFESSWFEICELSKYNNVRFILYGSDDYLYYLSVSKYLINNCTFPTYYIKKKEQIYINTWHGISIKKLGYDVHNSNIAMSNTIRNFLSTDYMLSANKHMTDVYLHSYKLDGLYNGTIIEEGQPRTDLFYADKEYVLRKLKSVGVNIDSTKKIVLYAPTWRGTLSNPQKNNYKEVENCIDKNKYQILYKSHHVTNDNKQDIPVSIDTNELLLICDILITDYSSIAFDFMGMGRDKKIIFYVPDYDEYKKKQGLYFDLKCNVAYNINMLKTYLNHIDNIKNIYVPQSPCASNILSIIFDGKEGNVIKANQSKTKLLFYVGDFKSNGVTTSFLSLIENINYDKFDVSLIVLNKTDEKYVNKINSLNKNVRVLCRAGTYAQTLIEECSNNIVLKMGIGSEYLDSILPREMYKREFRRCFGNCVFDKLINFTGYSPFYSFLFINSDGEKIIWQHNDMILDSKRVSIDNTMPLYEPLNSVFSTYKYYDKLISASEEVMKINLRNFNNIPSNKFYYAHNTIDYNRIFKMSKEDNGTIVDKNKINFVNNGRLSYAKNQIQLVKAFNKFSKQYDNCELYIIGDGELKNEIEKISCKNIHILGYQDNPYFTMQQCDYFIFPSLYEGQGISLLEARVLGLPIIVSDLPKMKGIFIDDNQLNINGFSESDIYNSLVEVINNGMKTYDFDYKKYNYESYMEFERAICE